MNVLIIEDEQITAERLEKMLKEFDPQIKIIDILDSIEDAVEWFKTHKEPDLLFLDIHLADGSSFEIFKEVEVHCPVIFTTAYDQYAIDAFRVNSIDYLLKPVKKEELVESLKKFEKYGSKNMNAFDYTKLSDMMDILDEKRKEYKKRYMIRVGAQIKVVGITEVAYFYINEKIVYLTTTGGRNYPIDQSLDSIEDDVDPSRFFRINRAFIVSLDAIEKMITYSKSRIKIKLNPPCELEAITSTERSGPFKAWLKGNYK